jgi:hypothetical protein
MFELYLEVRAFPKGPEKRVVREHYDTWKDADTAYEAYMKACRVPGSMILHVEFIEHRHTVTHKACSKPTGTTISIEKGSDLVTPNKEVIYELPCACAG